MSNNLSEEIFERANNEWQGIAASELDLIDPNLSLANLHIISLSVINNIKNLITEVTKISDKQENLTEFSNIIQQKLNEELNKILPNILPDSIFRLNFSILKSPLHILFFDQFGLIYKKFETDLNNFVELNQIDQINQFENIWKTFINDISNIYINIADTFWQEKKYFYPAALKQAKIKAAKVRIFSEAMKISEMEKNTKHEELILQPTREDIKYYRSVSGIPGLQHISGKKYFLLI